MSLEVEDQIGGIEEFLLEKLDEETLNYEMKGIEDWVMEPGNNATRIGIYERTIAIMGDEKPFGTCFMGSNGEIGRGRHSGPMMQGAPCGD